MVPSWLTLDEKSDTLWLLYILDEGVLLLAQRVLVHQTSVTKDVRCQVVHRVLRNTSTSKLQSAMSA